VLPPLRLLPELKERVWGGSRLGPGVGEAWLIYDANRVADGPFAGRTLADVAAELGARLLGTRSPTERFPLLVKILDAADWLSVQVHPDDTQAVELEGADQCGKAEAWHILEAAPGAKLIAGLKPGITAKRFERAIRDGSVLEIVEQLEVAPGDTVYNCAGLVHALGPGLLLYEVQQSSDITYRVWDWNRPASAGRALHVEQTLRVTRLDAQPRVSHGAGDECEQFALDLLGPESARPDTRGESFHAVTVVEGSARVAGVELGQFESVVVPADLGSYLVEPVGGAYRALLARVP
jgi:mannose-6-phosphate isomerase